VFYAYVTKGLGIVFAISPVQVVDWESEILHKNGAQVKPSFGSWSG